MTGLVDLASHDIFQGQQLRQSALGRREPKTPRAIRIDDNWAGGRNNRLLVGSEDLGELM